MYRNKNIARIIGVLFVYVVGHPPVFSQDTTFLKTNLARHWIRSGYWQDTLVFIPYTSSQAAELSPELRYGGITFIKDKTYHHHRWKMCGNDTGPDFIAGTWNLYTSDHSAFLTMTEENQPATHYKILESEPERLILLRSP